MVNIVVNGTLGLVRLRGMEVATNRYFQSIVIALTQEALAVAEARGIKGLDFGTFFTKVIPAARKDAGDHYPSMAQDIMIGKKQTEIEFLNGAIERMGKAAGVPTPVNATVANLIRTIEQNYDKQYYE
jgi:2-dehydropantoate 2-reductase